MKIKKILFICKDRDQYGDYVYGTYGLINSARFVGEALEKYYPGKVEFKVVKVADANKIDKAVHDYKPTHVVIEALWVVPHKFDELLPKYPRVKWYVRIHSKIPFLANEGIAIKWMKEYEKKARIYSNLQIAGNDKHFTEDMQKVISKEIIYMPNIYLVDGKFKLHDYTHSKHVNVGCFGAIRPLKNQLEQAVAAIIFAENLGKKLIFHMNGSRSEQRGDQVLENIVALFHHSQHKLILHPWLKHHEFLKLIKEMDLGMQVSFSESFNIVTADFVKEDIPIIVSDDITWMANLYKVSTTNTDEMVEKLLFAYRTKPENIQYMNKLALVEHNERSIAIWAHRLSL